MSGFEELMKRKPLPLNMTPRKTGRLSLWLPVWVYGGENHGSAMEQGSLYTRMIPLPRS